MRALAAVVLTVALAGCFSANPTDGSLRCNAQGLCPTGYSCISGTCWRNGDHPSTTVDMSMPSNGCGSPTDPQNCGTCGHDCTQLPHVTGAVTCSAGKCVLTAASCATGYAHCSSNPDDGCEANLSQPATCGSCANSCPSTTPLCTNSNGAYACVAMCTSPTPDRCGSQCTNIQSDPANCNGCGMACSFMNASATCTSGACQIGTCNTGYKHCANGPFNACETYVMGTDKNNCGDCAVVCSYPNAAASCSSGSCKMGACNTGFADCANTGTGCATNTTSDASNCGGCNKPCKLTESCSNSACGETAPSCGSGCTSTCTLPGQFSADSNVVVDYTNGKKLWERTPQAAQAVDAANTSCSSLNLDGITGWRLPTVAEYQQISVKCGGLNACAAGYCCPCIDQGAFPPSTNPTDYYWTADTNGKTGIYLQQYDYDTSSGRSFLDDPVNSTHRVRCIHDPI